MNNRFYLMSYKDVIKEFNSNVESGLKSKTVDELIKKYGKNVLPTQKGDSVIKVFFKGFLDPIVFLLVITGIISLLIGEIFDGIVIFFVVILDLILNTIEEYQAHKSASSLQKIIRYNATVIRDGEKIIVDSENLVPGDIIFFSSGDHIAADARIISCSNLQVDESVLTGESINVYKNSERIKKNVSLVDQKNMLFAGCSVVSGRAIAIVTSTGINTVVGNIFDTVSKIKEEKSPLTIRINKLSKQISIMIVIVAIIIGIVLKIKGISGSEIFMSVVALTVSAMPEGLPLALTMALTITSDMLVKKKVIVKKLNYVESLGSCTIIATDKTGTLTVNEQTAKIIGLPNGSKYQISGIGYNMDGRIEKVGIEDRTLIERIVLHGKLNNEAYLSKKNVYIGDSIDIAFQVLAKKNNTYSDQYDVIYRIPYESENKYSLILYQVNNEIICTVKGSIETILPFCSKMNVNNKKVKIDPKKLIIQSNELSRNGYRIIAIASGKIKKTKDYNNYNFASIKNLVFEGMVGFIDPIREEVPQAIQECMDAGVKVLMITGDHPLTAYAIGKEINLVNNYHEVTTGEEISKYLSFNEEKFDNFISEKKIFARVTPLEKLKIVESLKRMGEYVAVTGDGVNDSLAIRSANIGISMGSGTDTAKETAGMIITDDSFKSIVSGIELGRCAYSNIRKVCYFLLSCGLAELLFFLLSIIYNLPMPLMAIQLLWLNLVTDGFQDIALSYEKTEKDIMKRRPISTKESIFNRVFLEEVLISGSFISIVVFGIWYVLINKLSLDVSIARGYIMILMIFIQNIHVFNCRSETKSTFNISLKSNPLIIIAVFGSIILQIIVMEVPALGKFLKISPIPYSHLFVLVSFALTVLIAMEIYKLIRFKNKNF